MILLLTGCINPNGMVYTSLCNQEERKTQYINAINFYLSNTKLPIVFVDNSGTDISNHFQNYINSGRMEYITYSGNNDKQRGKGFGEAHIIEYALENSNIINSMSHHRIAKITGRLIIKNLNIVTCIHRILFSKRTVLCAINSELSFPDSRFIIADADFFKAFLKKKGKINDSTRYYFEHALCDTIKEDNNFPFSPFLYKPIIIGVSGSTGEIYKEDTLTIPYIIKYAKFALSQRHRFNKIYRQNK